MFRVYVAGPLSQNEDNVVKACKTAFQLMEAGLYPYIPHLTFHIETYVGQQPRDFWLEQDFAFLAVCDAVLRLPGESSGADAEVAFAHFLRIPVCGSTSAVLQLARESEEA